MTVRKLFIGVFVGLSSVISINTSTASPSFFIIEKDGKVVFTERKERYEQDLLYRDFNKLKPPVPVIGTTDEKAQAILHRIIMQMAYQDRRSFNAFVRSVSKLNKEHADILKAGLGIEVDRHDHMVSVCRFSTDDEPVKMKAVSKFFMSLFSKDYQCTLP